MGVAYFLWGQIHELGTATGRGRNIRYLSFFLEGLLTYPEYAFSEDGLRGIRFSLDWLGRIQGHRGGIPAVMGGNRVSLHQTARILGAVSRLLFLDESRQTLPQADRAIAMTFAAKPARTFRNAQSKKNGAWPHRAGGGVWSAAKTALATTALGYYSLVDPSTEVENSRRLGEPG